MKGLDGQLLGRLWSSSARDYIVIPEPRLPVARQVQVQIWVAAEVWEEAADVEEAVAEVSVPAVVWAGGTDSE